MKIRPYEYNIDHPRVMSFHLAPHSSRLAILKVQINNIILELKIDQGKQPTMAKNLKKALFPEDSTKICALET